MANVNALVDTNVAIDWLNSRQPWADEAKLLWESRDAGKIALYLPASVLTDIFYILRKPLGNEGAKRAIERCVAVSGSSRLMVWSFAKRLACQVPILRAMCKSRAARSTL